MNKKWILWGVILLTVINLASLGTIAYYKFFDHRDHKKRMHKMLKLDKDQMKTLHKHKEAMRKLTHPFKKQMFEKRRELANELINETPNRERIHQIKQSLDSIHSQIQSIAIDQLLAHKKFLTPEQQTQFYKMMLKDMPFDDSHRRMKKFKHRKKEMEGNEPW